MKSIEDISQFLHDSQSDNSANSAQNSQKSGSKKGSPESGRLESGGSNRKLPPVHLWHPTEQFTIDMVIKANGEWWYQGSKMTRIKLVTLFASILVVEIEGKNKHYYLKTPVQKAEITVEDAPLLVNDISITTEQHPQQPAKHSEHNTNYQILLTTTTEDTITLDKEHQVFFADYQGETRPYIAVRNGLHALISRPAFYHLLEIGELSEKHGKTILSLHSGGIIFSVEYPE